MICRQTIFFSLWQEVPVSFHSFIFRDFLYQPFLTDLASACMSSPFVANIVFFLKTLTALKTGFTVHTV